MIQSIIGLFLLIAFFAFLLMFAWYIAIPLFIIFCMVVVVANVWTKIKMWLAGHKNVEKLERTTSHRTKRPKEIIDVDYTEL